MNRFIDHFVDSNGSLEDILSTFGESCKDFLLIILCCCRSWFYVIHSFWEIAFTLIILIAFNHFTEVAAVLIIVNVKDWVLLESHLWHDFTRQVVDGDITDSELLGYLTSCHHGSEKWATFDYYLIKFVVIINEILLKESASCCSLLHSMA